MKKRSIICICLLIVLIMGLSIGLVFVLKKDGTSLHMLNIENVTNWKVEQTFVDLRNVDRNVPTTTSNEGCDRYPTYGTSLTNITDDEKTALINEANYLCASSSTYDSMDEDGNLYLNGESVNRKLYKHTSSVGMYYGNVDDNESGVVRTITVNPSEDRNYITGLYAPAGEVIEIKISSEDLSAIGGLTVTIGQTASRNVNNNIWSARNDFSRMPVIGNIMTIKNSVSYVGSYLGGPIYIRSGKTNVEYSVTISKAVKYPIYIHGYTTKSEMNNMKNLSAPYFDFELGSLGVRHSGPKSFVNYDYDNLYKCGELWKKINMTSRQIPNNSNKYLSVSYVYDCFVAAGAACAFVGGNTWVNAPCNWMTGSLNYDEMVTNGFWGNIHEFNHHFQNFGISPHGEVTNNAVSLLSYVLYTDISSNRSENDSTLGGGWNRYTDPTRSLRETISNGAVGQTGLNIYADIIHSFGVDIFINAAQLNAGNHTAEGWFESLCKATHYDMSYYFESMLGHTISDDIKSKYSGEDYPVFVPVSLLYQTGRDYYINNTRYFTNTVRPFLITKGEDFEIDLEKYLIVPNGFEYTVKNISKSDYGKITKVSDKKYIYSGNNNYVDDKFEITISLSGEGVTTKDVTFAVGIAFKDPLPTRTKYVYSKNVYTDTDDAVNNNFAGYDSKTIENVKTTFLNGIGAKQIGVTEGKIYIDSDDTYSFCLRAGRGNHALYLSVNNDKHFQKVISFSGDKGGFEFDNGHMVSLDLKAGDYVYYRAVTISNGHSDAFTEIGYTKNENIPVTIPSTVLYNYIGSKKLTSFESDEVYKKEYITSGVIYEMDSTQSTIVSVSHGEWDATTNYANMLDGDENTFYHSNRNNFVSESNPCEIIVDMGQANYYNNLLITNRKTGKLHMPSTFKLYGGETTDDMQLLGDYKNLSYSGYTLSVNFDSSYFRYFKMVITDTDAHVSGTYDKYVSIAELKMRYSLDNLKESSPDYYEYYYFDINKHTLGSFGHVIEGNGKIKLTKTFSNFVLKTKQSSSAKIKINIDGREREIWVNGDNNLNLIATDLTNASHNVEIFVLEGVLVVDSYMFN